MICEYCGGEVLPCETYKHWKRGECENCKTGYAFRHTKEFHTQTLKEIFGKDYDAIIKAYKNHIQRFINESAV